VHTAFSPPTRSPFPTHSTPAATRRNYTSEVSDMPTYKAAIDECCYLAPPPTTSPVHAGLRPSPRAGRPPEPVPLSTALVHSTPPSIHVRVLPDLGDHQLQTITRQACAIPSLHTRVPTFLSI
jgi:hypothetical protein